MTIQEAINRLDALRPNAYTVPQKIQWLSDLDGQLQREVLDGYCATQGDFTPYTEDTSPETELLVKAPYDGIYEHWLCSKVDYANMEMNAYNNAAAMYEMALAAWKNDVNRRNCHKRAAIRTI